MKVNNVTPTNEIGKYIKKKESNTSNAKKKSKHKHIYSDCLLINVGKPYLPNHNVFLGRYCEICGKIDNWRMVWDCESRGLYKYYTGVDDEETLQRYSHLPHFETDDIYKIEKVEV